MIPANQAAETDLAEFVMLCGSKRSAAKAIGVPRKTLCRWLLDIERTGKINARPSRVRGAMERISAVRAKMRQDGPCYDVADAFMSVFGYHRVGRGDDMTCASFPGQFDDATGQKHGQKKSRQREKRNNDARMDATKSRTDCAGVRNSQTANDFATSAFATTQGTNYETVQRLMRESVHKSQPVDEKARKLLKYVGEDGTTQFDVVKSAEYNGDIKGDVRHGKIVLSGEIDFDHVPGATHYTVNVKHEDGKTQTDIVCRIEDNESRKTDGWKHVLVVSDLHCGHSVGLTPPGRWQGEDYEIQREVWEFYEREVNAHGPYDACFDLGDNIDGRGSKSGGTELITNDLLDQTDIATQCLLAIPTDKFYMVYGTPYHVSVEGTDMERQIADNLKLHGKEVTISGHEWIDVSGCVFDIKHKVGSSGTPYGRHTAISKARIWNDMWSLRNMAPKADVFLRGHVHYHVDCGGVRNGRPWRAMTLPALQGPGSKFGVRQCEGEVNFGFVVFHVSPEGRFTWDVHEFQPKAGQPVASVL